MKSKLITGFALITLLSSCQKKIEAIIKKPAVKNEVLPTKSNEFVKYSILKGEQYCNTNTFEPVSYQKLAFVVKFDSSAVYQTVKPGNQTDINKLFGFSDNNQQHHQFSARVGWRWSDNALRLFGYVYNNGTMSWRELGTVAIGTENNCSIEVKNNQYIFTLNNRTEVMPRESSTVKAEGYRLYPYFGGDELAPHNISIWIKLAAAL